MQQLFAILTLTWKAAFRYRLFWVLASLLLLAVVGLPILIKDDGTAEGFAQILITYTLGAVTALLGFCTMWLSCGTLARDIEESQIQMVAVKPIARWQIWLGKWLGIVTLDAALLAVAGASIFGLLEWRARKLPAAELDKLQSEVLVARASAKETGWQEAVDKQTEKQFKLLIENKKLGNADPVVVEKQIENQVRGDLELVPPGGLRWWLIDLGSDTARLKDQPMFLRVKFNTAQVGQSGTFFAAWRVGDATKVRAWEDTASLAPETFHEFKIAPNLFDEKGKLIIYFRNLNETALIFPLNDGMEVLYRVGGFGLNFVRGLGIILCWMALLSAVGLAAASFLSFPVAAFFSVALLTIVLSSGTISNVVQEGTIMGYNEEKGTKGHSVADNVAVPTFKGLLEVITMVEQYSPIDSLTTGRSITWAELGSAFAQIVLVLGGIFALFGIYFFYRRELAAAQGTH